MKDFSWLNLSVDLWVAIYHRLNNVFDRLFFSSVCSLFKSIEEEDPIRLSQPLLLIRFSAFSHHQLFSLTNNKLYSCSIPELQGKLLCGSSNGWLLIMDYVSGDMNLFNPLTRALISLPSLSSSYFDFSFFQDYHLNHESDRLVYVGKFTMSHTEDDGFIVMVAFKFLDSVAFCQTGDTKWTILDFPLYFMQDFMYYNGKFCAIDINGAVIAWDINAYKKGIARDFTGSEETFRIILRGGNEKPAIGKLYIFYIVESLSGELLKICRVVDYGHDKFRTSRFRVYKLDERKNWITVRSLGDQSLFLGSNQSICLSSLNHPEFQADCIYFTDDDGSFWYHYGVNDVGVYSLKNRTVQPLLPNHHFWTNVCLWIAPSLR